MDTKTKINKMALAFVVASALFSLLHITFSLDASILAFPISICYTAFLFFVYKALFKGEKAALLSLFKTTELNTTLDTVDYADIDTSATNKEEKLPINNC